MKMEKIGFEIRTGEKLTNRSYSYKQTHTAKTMRQSGEIYFTLSALLSTVRMEHTIVFRSFASLSLSLQNNGLPFGSRQTVNNHTYIVHSTNRLHFDNQFFALDGFTFFECWTHTNDIIENEIFVRLNSNGDPYHIILRP